MAIVRTIPSRRIINGMQITTSEISMVSELDYRTNGESCVIDSRTTDHVVVKSMTQLTIRPDVGKIDEDYDEIVMDRYACVEFRFVGGTWYILSSDGLKNS